MFGAKTRELPGKRWTGHPLNTIITYLIRLHNYPKGYSFPMKKTRLSEVTGRARIWLLVYANPQPMCFPPPLFLKWEKTSDSPWQARQTTTTRFWATSLPLLSWPPPPFFTADFAQPGFHLVGSCLQIACNLSVIARLNFTASRLNLYRNKCLPQ